jgi:PhnB protein
MARTSTYLNFMGKTEEAFQFYRSVFRTEFDGPIMYMRDVPGDPSAPTLSDHEQGMVMHVSLPITGDHRMMGTDALESRGHTLTFGNNVSINLEPDTRAETERLFAALSEGATDIMPLQDMFWGDLFGSLTDRYGVMWMFNGPAKD